MENFDVLVAGAGIWGCTLARRLAEIGYRVLVLEARPVVGGNVRCEIDPETGIEIHTYGSHIFHTHFPEVWEFINRFVSFNGYQHKVLAFYQGKTYFLPLGLSLINKFFNAELKPGEVDNFLQNKSHREELFNAFFLGYSCKQWGKPPEDIDSSIIKRIPVRSNYDVNYFNDYWQGIPSTGYNSFFRQLLAHNNIKVQCGKEFTLESELSRKCTSENIPVYYSGPIDKLFNYKFGSLSWRSLRFEQEKLDIEDFQGTSVINYTEISVPYTRIHEFKHFHPEKKDIMCLKKTIIMREYPKAWTLGEEPFYPIQDSVSKALFARYTEEAHRCYPNLTLGGRLGAYKYYDMDQTMKAALDIAL
ncbi:MAG: NAD(P)-binding protein [Victivallales bacterium]|nr:NAD(P)-binding protein [Victivallales bacterium]